MRRSALLAMYLVLAPLAVLGEEATPAPVPPSARWVEPSPDVAKLLTEGAAEFQAGRFRAARKRFQEADELAGARSWDAVAGIASTSIQLGNYVQAEDFIQQLLEGDPAPARAGLAHQLMGMCFVRQNRLREAETAFLEALELRPDRPMSTRAALATVLCGLGREEEGLELLDDDGRCAREEVSATDEEAAEAPHPFEEGGEYTEPVKLWGNSPRYPEAARLAFVEGKVTLRLIIGADGAVRCVRVIDGLPLGLSCSAAVAVSSWKFKPSTEQGEPVECTYVLDVRFDLQ